MPEEVKTCECSGDKPEPHECPYSEISRDETLCTCCEYCEKQCALDV